MDGKCKLCMNYGMLQKSHIFPRFLYKNMIKAIKEYAIDPNLQLIKGFEDDPVIRRSDQLVEHLLCKDCEERFRRNGEAPVANLLQSSPTFLFINSLQSLSTEILRIEPGGGHVIEVRELGDSKLRNALSYMILSILWRFSQLVARSPLGPYTEPLRHFLLNPDEIPQGIDVRLEIICPRIGIDTEDIDFDHTLDSPIEHRVELSDGGGFRSYKMQIFDMMIDIWVGGMVPRDPLRSLSIGGRFEISTVTWKRRFDELKERHKDLIR